MSICFSAIVEGLLAAAKACTHTQSPDGVVLVRKGGSWSLWVVDSKVAAVPPAPAHATGGTPSEAAKALVLAGCKAQTMRADETNLQAVSSRSDATRLDNLYKALGGMS